MPRRWCRRASRRAVRAAIAVALLAAAARPAAAANAVVPDAPAQLGLRGGAEATLQLEVFVNGRPRHVVAQFSRLPDGGLAATGKELREAGVLASGGETAQPLAAIKGLRYRYDELRQAIFLELPDALVDPARYSAARPRFDSGPASSDWGAAVNYDAYATTSAWKYGGRLRAGAGSLSLDGRAFSPYGSLTQTAIAGSTVDSSSSFLRLDTSLEHEDGERQLTYRAGDFVNGGLPWTRPVRLGGIQVQHDFASRPDLITSPLASASGTAAVPSSVDVYVNNFRVFTQQVDAGPFRIEGLPSIGGSGQTTLVLRDVTGKEVRTSLPFYVSSRLLAPGTYEYSGEAGYARTYYGARSFSYQPDPLGSATLRGGIADWATAEAHAEGGRAMQNVGGGLVLNAFNRGIVDVALAGSRSPQGFGALASAGLSTQLYGFALDASSQRSFKAYQDLASVTAPQTNQRSTLASLIQAGVVNNAYPQVALANAVAPPRALDRVSLTLPDLFLHAAANVSFLNLKQADGTRSRILSAGLSRSFQNRASVYVSGYRDFAGAREAGVFLGVSLSLSQTIAASAQATAQRKALAITTEATRAAGEEPGSYGWRLVDSEGANRYRAAQGAYQSAWGRAIVSATEYRASGKSSSIGAAEFAGSVAALGGAVRLGPTIADSVAMVDAGAPGVRVLGENRYVGTTDWSGRLLVPGLRAHQPNKLAIDPDSLPPAARAEQTEMTLNPRARSGLVADFRVAAVARDAEVILKLPDGAPVPAGARVELEAGGPGGIVGYDGRTYLSGLAPRNRLTVRYGAGTCRADVEYAARKGEARPLIGPLLCVP